jgi:hypothetical protein
MRMTSIPVLIAGLAIGGVAIPVAVWVGLGPRRRRDRILLAGAIVVVGFGVAGIGKLVTEGPQAAWDLAPVILVAIALRPRWRAASQSQRVPPEA